ncbi:amino acid adenylation domain-containing protein [Streptomyces sp. TRM 70351]|uniref:amino acid adenylation domain-containing protein n=1 Tax=Streptomyces sp. TRM 70351 TaxID=3116552 RepID=UPI002E7C366B|nr:amino acid adenylation domain-containing protein [Streptomyces sp. TRM 70351]MEE1928825.1 amino acid adenylation domain-containing protein [Streptomyces sp. TRM 70351]
MVPAQLRGIPHHWNDTTVDYPRDALIPHLFAEQARRCPDAPAVVWDGDGWNYRELYTRVRCGAASLRSHGVSDGDLVGVLLERSPGAVAAVLAVLEAGGVFVPLDPVAPASRLETVLRAAGTRHVVTAPGRAPSMVRRLCRCVSTDELAAHPEPDSHQAWAVGRRATDPAYVMYTSGSTGTPKGVVCPHRGPVRLVKSGGALQVLPDDRLLATTCLTFDVSCLEMFGPLLNGACLIVPAPETPLSTEDLHRVLRDQRASVMWLSAGLFDQHVQQRPEMFRSLRCLITGGDVVSPSSARAVLEHGRPRLFINGYGPTENSVLSVTHRIEDVPANASSVPIGRPIPNATAHVVREDGELAAPGEVGELWLGGDGVALEYLGAPDITSRSFVPDRFGPDPKARLYRSGDLAYWHPDGNLEYCGRRDRQIKIRGYRIELGEVESALTSHPRILEAAVDVQDEGSGRHLAAAVVLTPGSATEDIGSEILAHARDRLPGYMMPRRIDTVCEIPLTSSGKVDRKRLLEMTIERRKVQSDRPSGDAPLNSTERVVAEVWADVLDVDMPRRDDYFSVSGGNSLRAAQVASATQKKLGMPSAGGNALIHSLANDPTVKSYARQVQEILDAGHPEHEGPDLASEAVLDPSLHFAVAPASLPVPPFKVLLTGGTGFLGVHLIDSLTSAGAESVFCLVRARDSLEARARIAARMRRYGLDPEPCGNVVVPVVGDLAKPRFGLEPHAWNQLSESVDIIVHNGAQVNFSYPYETLQPANVAGTRTVLELAEGPRPKPVHYVSTITVLSSADPVPEGTVHEGSPLQHPENLMLGYTESKWVAERLVVQASQRGLPVSVYRPYEITGNLSGGIWNTDTMMCALFRTITEIEAAPDIELPLNFVPVDYTADALAHILVHERPDGRAYHLVNSVEARLSLLVDRLRTAGYPVEIQPYQVWVERLVERVAADRGHPMAPYLPLLAEPAAPDGRSVLETYCAGTFPEFNRTNAEHALRTSGITCPPVDVRMIDTYVRYFRRSGFFAPPGAVPGARR